MKTSELTGAALDWAVSKCLGFDWEFPEIGDSFAQYSSDWSQGGPIIEREKISLEYLAGAGDAGTDVWVATRHEQPCVSEERGATPLIAAMRCYVASKLGDEVEIPEEINREHS